MYVTLNKKTIEKDEKILPYVYSVIDTLKKYNYFAVTIFSAHKHLKY